MKCNDIEHLLLSIPVNYPIGVVFVNGVAVEVASFSNVDVETGLAYFLDADGQIVVLDTLSIDGVAFGDIDTVVDTGEGSC